MLIASYQNSFLHFNISVQKDVCKRLQLSTILFIFIICMFFFSYLHFFFNDINRIIVDIPGGANLSQGKRVHIK